VSVPALFFCCTALHCGLLFCFERELNDSVNVLKLPSLSAFHYIIFAMSLGENGEIILYFSLRFFGERNWPYKSVGKETYTGQEI